jgi:dienelactone hydrolase
MPAALLPTVLALAVSVTSPGPGDGFRITSGADTIATERFTASPRTLEGELVLHGAGLRMAYAIRFGDDGAAEHATIRAFRGAGTEPAQSVELEFARDSAVATVSPGGSVRRFACPPGAVPYINPSMAMIERAVRAAGGGGHVSLFTLAGGQVVDAVVTRAGADSVRVDLAGVEMRFALGEGGRIERGVVPAQGLVVTRTSGEAATAAAARDYSEPADSPCTAEEVRVPCPGGFALAGTFTRPRGASGRVPCVVMITGSGLEDRDESIPGVAGYRPFRQFARAFARAGLATLRLDDRGFGDSGGDPSRATTADFADDTRAALAWLRTRPDVDTTRLALAGHSEGGIIAPMVAADDGSVRAVVLVAGPAWTGRHVIESQNRYALGRDGARTPAQVDSIVTVAMAKVDSIAAGQPWLAWFLAHDPLPVLRRVRVPVLVVQGGTDRQVDPRQADELVAALRAAGNRRVTLRALPGLDHLLLRDPSGDPAGYGGLPERTIDPALLDSIAAWTREALGR